MSNRNNAGMVSNDVVVSICCLAYNHAPYIRECLEGFLMQRVNFPFEVLIHDDASTDGTADIIREYQEKYPDIIKPVIQKENQYSKGVRNISAKYNFSRAKGRYIAMCEGDDYWTDPLKLQKQVDFLEVNSDFFACFHHRKIKKKDGVVVSARIKKKDFTKDTTLIGGDIIQTSIQTLSLMLRNDLNEYINLSAKNILGGDVLLRSFISTKGKVRYLHFQGGVYRKHDGGVFSSLKRLDALYKSIETRLIIAQVLPNVDTRSIYISICKIYISIIREKIKSGDFSCFRDFLKLFQYSIKALIK